MSNFKVIGTPLYQWETGRKMQVVPLTDMRVDAVHFSNLGDTEALVVKPREEDGMIVADIPNVLLQSGRNIVVLSVNISDASVETLKDSIFSVRNRPKPADYIYTETEVWTAEKAVADALAEQLPTMRSELTDYIDEQLEDIGGGGGGSAEGAVLYTKQTLTPEQQTQARENIGAADASVIGDIETALDGIIAIQNKLIGDGIL